MRNLVELPLMSDATHAVPAGWRPCSLARQPPPCNASRWAPMGTGGPVALVLGFSCVEQSGPFASDTLVPQSTAVLLLLAYGVRENGRKPPSSGRRYSSRGGCPAVAPASRPPPPCTRRWWSSAACTCGGAPPPPPAGVWRPPQALFAASDAARRPGGWYQGPVPGARPPSAFPAHPRSTGGAPPGAASGRARAAPMRGGSHRPGADAAAAPPLTQPADRAMSAPSIRQ